MIFFFGRYSLKIKTYRPADLRYKSTDSDHLRLELRVSVYHFMFVPFVPKVKFWRVIDERTNEEVPEVNTDLKHLMNMVELRKRNPFYAYSGLIGMGLVILGIFLLPMILRLSHNQEMKEWHEEILQEKWVQVNELRPGDGIVFEAAILKEKRRDVAGKKYAIEFRTRLNFRIVQTARDSITIAPAKKWKSYEKKRYDEHFKQGENSAGYFIIPKNKLFRAATLRLLTQRINNIPEKQGVEIKEIRDLTLFKVTAMTKHDKE